MKSATLALIHTSPVLVPTFSSLCAKHLPEAEVFHVVDESLIKNTIRAGKLECMTVRRVAGHISLAEQGGARAVLVTCSSIGPAIPAARPLFDIPVLRIDEAMARRAVEQGQRIGVLATLGTTLEPTVALLEETAAEVGREVDIVEHLCEGAFEAVVAGDVATHDAKVNEGLARLLAEADVVVLAQASMARVVDRWPAERRTRPILASPELAILEARRALSLSAPAPAAAPR